MPSLTFDTLPRALKNGEPAPVYYVFGAENLLKDDAVRLILDRALDPSLRDFNFDQRSLATLDPESLTALLETLPMMAERRVVVLRDLEQLKRKTRLKATLERYLEHPSPETVLILVQASAEDKPDPALTRRSTTVEVGHLKPDRVPRWIAHQAGLSQTTLTPEAIQHLIDVVGPDLAVLRTEIEKIASLGAGEAVTVEQVAALLGVRREETLPRFRDLVFAGKAGEAAAILGPLLEQGGMSGVKIVAQLGSAVVGIGMARSWYDRGLRGNALSRKLMERIRVIRPFGIGDWGEETSRWASLAPRWPEARVGAALAALLAADRALKTTRISDERGVLLDLVFQLTEQRRGEAA